MRSVNRALLVAMSVVVLSCGGKPAAAPSSEPSTKGAAAAASNEPKPEGSAAEKPKDAPFVRGPQSVLSDSDATFVLAFDQTEVGKAADEKCTASSKQDPKKRSECLAQARDRIQVGAMRFRKDSSDAWWWETLRPKGTSYAVLRKTQVEFGEEKDRTIVIKPKGGAPVTFEVPNDYSIVVKDAQHGRLVYEARLSMTTTAR